jgi:hypothetical protein
MLAHGFAGLTPWTVVVAALMQPLETALHELGHASVARLVGLDLAAVELGFGKRIWKRQVGAVLFVLRRWPLSGRTYFGAHNRNSVRLRVWLTTLAGPAVNAALILPAVLWWQPLTRFFGSTRSCSSSRTPRWMRFLRRSRAAGGGRASF